MIVTRPRLAGLAGTWYQNVLCPFWPQTGNMANGYSQSWCGDLTRTVDSAASSAANSAVNSVAYFGVPSTVRPPAPGSPQLPDMTAWNTDKLAAADRENFKEWAKDPYLDLPEAKLARIWDEATKALQPDFTPLWWIALGVGGLVVLFIAVKR